MITISLDGAGCCLRLPRECCSVAAAIDYVKQQLGAVWARTSTPAGSPVPPAMCRFEGSALADLTDVSTGEPQRCICAVIWRRILLPPNHTCGESLLPRCCAERGAAAKKRLFLSPVGWQPGGAAPDDAGLLAFGAKGGAAAPAADQLPASLLRGGLLHLQAFTPEHSQASLCKRRHVDWGPPCCSCLP